MFTFWISKILFVLHVNPNGVYFPGGTLLFRQTKVSSIGNSKYGQPTAEAEGHHHNFLYRFFFFPLFFFLFPNPASDVVLNQA